MNDKYPENFDLEIDREALANYKKACWIVDCTVVLVTLSLPIGLIFSGNISNQPWAQGALMGIVAFFLSMLLSVVSFVGLALILYVLVGRKTAEAYARSLEVRVEGPFLVIRQGDQFMVDRKLHFRAIVDYSIIEGPIMNRHGIKALSMTTASSSQTPVVIHGLKNTSRVRDQLAEIDALREF